MAGPAVAEDLAAPGNLITNGSGTVDHGVRDDMTADFTVLGGRGYVGSHLIRYLQANGASCDVPERDDRSFLARRHNHIVYCIGLTADYQSRPFDTVEAHTSLFSEVLRQGQFESLIYLSSTRLYDSGGGHTQESADLVLNPTDPRHIYDLSKALGEALCASAGRKRAHAARLSCVYSDDLSGPGFLDTLIRRALSETRIVIDTRLDSARDYVHIDDVCRALVAIAKHGHRPIYNVASGVNVSNGELFDLIAGQTGCGIEAADRAPSPMPNPPVVDIQALREDCGIVPRQLVECLGAIVAAHQPQAQTLAGVT